MKMIQDKIKWTKYLNIIFLILEYPFAYYLSEITLDRSSHYINYNLLLIRVLILRFMYCFVPLLVCNVTLTFIIKQVLRLFAKKIYQSFVLKRFILYHNIALIVMILVILITHLIIDGYV